LVDYIVDKTDAKVTFFHVAEFHYPFAFETEEYQNAMKKAHDNGLQIASHTWGHKISKDTNEFKESLTNMDDFIEKVTGDRPHYFRAPKGDCDDTCQENLDKWNYRLIQWDTDTNDWDLESSGSAEQRVKDSIDFLKKEFAKEKDNYLILMHDSQEYTVHQIAPWIIEESGMKEKGYRFVTVAECLGEKDYMYVSGKTFDKTEKSKENNDSSSSETNNKSIDNTNTKNNETNSTNENDKNNDNTINDNDTKNESNTKDDNNTKNDDEIVKNNDNINNNDNVNNNNNSDKSTNNDSYNIVNGNNTDIDINKDISNNLDSNNAFSTLKPMNLLISIILSIFIFTLLNYI